MGEKAALKGFGRVAFQDGHTFVSDFRYLIVLDASPLSFDSLPFRDPLLSTFTFKRSRMTSPSVSAPPTVTPTPTPTGETSAERERFEVELEFVQCLASPTYLNCKSSPFLPSSLT